MDFEVYVSNDRATLRKHGGHGTLTCLNSHPGAIIASRSKNACDRLKSGAASRKSIAYAAGKEFERETGVSADDRLVNIAMRRGAGLEPRVRLVYEVHTGNLVVEAGIALTDDRRLG